MKILAQLICLTLLVTATSFGSDDTSKKISRTTKGYLKKIARKNPERFATVVWIKSKHVPYIMKYLPDTLQKFDILKSEIGDEGVKYLTQALTHRSSIEILVLSNNQISGKGAQYIGDLLEKTYP